MPKYTRALCWIRRDLRLKDHAALSAASKEAESLVVAFNFDLSILKHLADKDDKRVTFIQESVSEIDQELQQRGSQLLVRYGDPIQEIPEIAKALGIDAVYCNEDYEPAAIARDKKVAELLEKLGIQFHSFKDQVIFEKKEILNGSGQSFKVFTPYKNAWLKNLNHEHVSERKVRLDKLLPKKKIAPHCHAYDFKALGFSSSSLWLKSGRKAGLQRLKAFSMKMPDYLINRDYPGVEGTSGISVHLRFGTLSVREAMRQAQKQTNSGSLCWINELIWRDFYQMVLSNNPHVVGHAFKPECDKIIWPGTEEHFLAWQEGKTGYPLVDAAMRHFNKTGWMHNRLRMVVAAFLTKDLLVDWRLGESYFARKLLDFDLAANNGGWQWSASTGCDSQPYFRIFNPITQSEKFDPQGNFIRDTIPELRGLATKEIHKAKNPIVNHNLQRMKALYLFKKE